MNSAFPVEEFINIFNNISAAVLLIDVDAPLYTILGVNEAYLQSTNSSRAELVGRSVFGAFPANPTDEDSKNIERTILSFEQAISTRKPHTMSDYRYDIPIRGTDQFEERYWTTTNTPILDQHENVKYLIHSPANVTELHKLADREKAGLQALKEQRAQLYSTFMQAPVGIAIFRGPDYVVDLINPPLCVLYGKTIDEMLGRPVFDVLTHAKGLGFEGLLDKVRLTGESFKGKGLAAPLERNGEVETVFLDFVYEPFREDDGTISGVIAVAIEVTEQVEAKKQLEDAEERARLAIDAVGLGTYDLDLETGDMITSTRFANIFGFESPVPRVRYIESFHPDDLIISNEAHEDAKKTGRLFYEARVIWPDQTIHWVRAEGRVYFHEDHAIRILGTILDTTDQKNSREEQQKLAKQIAENELLLRNITKAAPTGLWMSDENGEITYINQTWIDWTGLSYESNLGTGWLNAIIAEERTRVGEQLLSDLKNRGNFEVEFRIGHIDNTQHWCVATGKPQYNVNDSFVGYIGACVDITEQKNLQLQKDNFISIASHELKTPVTSIKAYTQVLEKMLLKKGDNIEAGMISKMDKQLNRLNSLIGDLLDVTKINAGKLQFNDQYFDFNAHVVELIDDLQRTLDKHLLIKDLKFTGSVFGDPERIGQVIVNLITNAVKYSPNTTKIVIETKKKNQDAVLCVKDFGIGIAEKNLDRVFEQFYRVSGNMQHTFPGLGLGLYISSEIIKRENGKIWVTSQEGKGSTFCFSIPAKP